MNTTLVLWCLAFLLLFHLDNCSVITEKEHISIKLTDEWGERVGYDSSYVFKVTDTTDVTLPPIVTRSVGWSPPAGRAPRLTDTVVVKAIVTKRGYVKRVWIASSTNPYFNKAILKSVLLTQYQPALRKGIPYDTLITVTVPLKPTP